MNLDDLARGQGAAEGGFQRHPVGDYNGQVENIKQREVKGTPVWDINITTEAGIARHQIWGFSQADLQEAGRSQDAQDKAIRKIGYIKKLYVDLGVWPNDEAVVKAKSWSDIMQDMQFLIGKLCHVRVEASRKKEGEVVVWVNPPAEGAVQPVQQQAAVGNGQPVQQQQQHAAVPGVQQQGSPAGTVGGLDDIPF